MSVAISMSSSEKYLFRSSVHFLSWFICLFVFALGLYEFFIYLEYLPLLCWSLSHVCLFVTLWNVAHQAPLSMEFSRQEYWSGVPCPPPGDLPDPGLKSESPELQADFLLSESPVSSHSVVVLLFC